MPAPRESEALPTLAILAGGLATRMRPLTERLPKSMIEVAGQPFIAHQLRLLAAQGVRDVVLCVGAFARQIEQYVGDGSAFDLRVRYVHDGETPRGTGGALAHALPQLGSSFFIMYGDSYLHADLRAMHRAFLASHQPAMMAVFRNQGRWDQSNVEYESGMVRAYDKHLSTSAMQYIDYGIGLLSANLFDGRSAAVWDLAELYAYVASHGQLAGFEVDQRFYEIGSPAGLAELDTLLRERSLS